MLHVIQQRWPSFRFVQSVQYGSVHLERVEYGGQVLVELDVDNGTDDLGHAPDRPGLRRGGGVKARSSG